MLSPSQPSSFCDLSSSAHRIRNCITTALSSLKKITSSWPLGFLTATDPQTGSVVSADRGTSSLCIGNWIDGPGFDLTGGGACPDLALNGPQDFTLSFTHVETKIGLAVSTGLRNFPGHTVENGAFFQLTTNTGAAATLTLAPGSSTTFNSRQ